MGTLQLKMLSCQVHCPSCISIHFWFADPNFAFGLTLQVWPYGSLRIASKFPFAFIVMWPPCIVTRCEVLGSTCAIRRESCLGRTWARKYLGVLRPWKSAQSRDCAISEFEFELLVVASAITLWFINNWRTPFRLHSVSQLASMIDMYLHVEAIISMK